MNNQLEQIRQLLASSSKEQRQELFRELRKEFPIHAIEQKLNAEAEIILEAISRAGDLTLRGIRGIIAEAAFATKIVETLQGWKDITPVGNHPYDFVLTDGQGDIRIQVKMQRQKSHRPMMQTKDTDFYHRKCTWSKPNELAEAPSRRLEKTHGLINSMSLIFWQLRYIRRQETGLVSYIQLIRGYCRDPKMRNYC